MIEIDKPFDEITIQKGQKNAKDSYEGKNLNEYQANRVKDHIRYDVWTDTAFNYDEKEGELWLNITIARLGIVINEAIKLNPRDKYAILNFINKDNNRIKSQIEEMQHMLKSKQ